MKATTSSPRHVVKWLGEQAEALGVEVYPALPAAERAVRRRNRRVAGVITGDMGVGSRRHARQPLSARHGAARQIHAVRRRLPRSPRQAARSALQAARRRRSADLRPRHQGTVGGPAGKSQPGLVVHTAGWPLDDATYGGGFIYHLKTIWLPSATSSASITATRGCRPSRSSSATRPTRSSANSSRAASAWPTAPAPSRPAACRACPSWCSRAAR
jgi:hypothetical protein